MVNHNLTQPLTARVLRIHPMNSNSIAPCARVELYGCTPSEGMLCLRKSNILGNVSCTVNIIRLSPEIMNINNFSFLASFSSNGSIFIIKVGRLSLSVSVKVLQTN